MRDRLPSESGFDLDAEQLGIGGSQGDPRSVLVAGTQTRSHRVHARVQPGGCRAVLDMQDSNIAVLVAAAEKLAVFVCVGHSDNSPIPEAGLPRGCWRRL